MAKNPSIAVARSRRDPIFMCRKCLKRVADGRGIKKAVKSELKREPGAPQRRRPRIVMTNCFGICPKRAVVIASRATLGRGQFLLLADRKDAATATQMLMPDEIQSNGERGVQS